MKGTISASEFFQKGKDDLRIRYGSSDLPPVVIFCFVPNTYAWAEEEGTKRHLFLFLRGGMLVDQDRNVEADSIELVPA